MRGLTKAFNQSIEIVSQCSVLGLVICLSLQVITRYIFTPFPWTEEVARFFFIWSAFLGAALVSRDDGHIVVDVIINHVPNKVRVILAIIGKGITIGFLGAILWGSFLLLDKMLVYKAAATQLPMIVVFLCIPISAALMVCYEIALISRLLLSLGKKVENA